MKKIVFTFGRFQPPTTGHLLLATKVKEVARKLGAEHRIYGSNTVDKKKNPLSGVEKLRYMKKVLKGFSVFVDKQVKTAFVLLQQLSDEGYTDVTMVVGADRVNEFKSSISKYVGPNKDYKFDNFNVVSAGERDPDAEGVVGMSASKMRAAAAEGNFDAFKLGVPSTVSPKDAMGLFKAIRRGMGIRGKIQESWFNYDEFMEFAESFTVLHEETQELNELSARSRRKMAITAKRTAKKRARKRKIKEKRRKGKGDLTKKANKTAMMKMREKIMGGSKWNDMSFGQREKIDARLKKKKKKIKQIAKRLMPSMIKSEAERLKKVRARMTATDPSNAIENVDISFETFLLEVVAQNERSRNKDKEINRGQGASDPKERDAARKEGERKTDQAGGKPRWKDLMLVRNEQDKIILILSSDYKEAIHDVEVQKGKVTKGAAGEAANDPDWKWTDTATKLISKKQETASEKTGKADETESKGANGADVDGAEQVPMTKDEKELATKQTELDKANTELELKQVKQATKEFDDQKAAAKEAEEKRIPSDGKEIVGDGSIFPDWDHDAVDNEVGVVYAFNQERGIKGGDKISAADQQKLSISSTLMPAGTRIVEQISKQLPEGMKAIHYGRADINLSTHWTDHGGTDKTPKTDLYFEDAKTGDVITASMKAGAGQLMSGGRGETNATLTAVLSRLRGCGSVDANGQGLNCGNNTLENEPKTIKKLESIIKKIETNFDKSGLGTGMGPSGWWLQGGKIKGKKPAWWDTNGPGSKGVQWKDVVGTAPEPADFENFDAKSVEKLKAANTAHKEVMADVRDLFANSRSFKKEVMYEAITGCAKFCGCCNRNICGCSKAVPTHMLTMNKDGTSAGLVEINDEYIEKIYDKVNISVRMKSTSRLTSVEGKKVKRGGYNWWSAFGLTVSGFQTEERQTFREFANDIETPSNNAGEYVRQAKQWIGKDIGRLLEFLDADIDMTVNHDNLADVNVNDSGEYTDIEINGKQKQISINQDIEYSDVSESLDERFQHLTEPDVLDTLANKLISKGMDNSKAYAIATSSLQKRGVLKKGTHDLADDYIGEDKFFKSALPDYPLQTELSKESWGSGSFTKNLFDKTLGRDAGWETGDPTNPLDLNLKTKKVQEEGGAGKIGTKKLLKRYIKDTPHMTIDDKFTEEF